jgi:sulfite reductase (NADPH) flavoprotein alpha-component
MSTDETGRLTRRYLEGLAHGREAASLLPDTAPFSPEQKAWLSGFLSGLFGRGDAPEPRLNPSRTTIREPQAPVIQRPERRVEPGPAKRPASPLPYHVDNPYAARLLRVTPFPDDGVPECFQVAVDIEGSDIEFQSGDCVGIRRQTDPDKVRDVLRRLSARGQEPVPSREGSAPAWRVLLEEVDIERPTREFVALLTRSARDRDERATLEADREEPRDGMNISGYLRRFPSARPDLSELVRTLYPIEPTLHSIVRSPLADRRTLELLVVPAASAVESSRREVPCAVFADLAAGRLHRGDWLPVYVSERSDWRLPADPGAPVIFVGSGLPQAASFHALLDERSLTKAGGRNWLLTATPSGEAGPFHAAFLALGESRLLTRYDAVEGGSAELIERLNANRDMLGRWFLDGAVVYVGAQGVEGDRVVRALGSIFGERSLAAESSGAARLRIAG